MARLILSTQAQTDLDEISIYIGKERTPEIADAVIARIFGAMRLLTHAPRIGRIRREFPDRPRSHAVPPHVIFYEPLADNDGIAVWRVLHGARDLRHLVTRPFGGTKP